jgi:2-polyprenyl-3-methyl-5-hydroxy-6-metoxy-1,4-benzoquinol methylase
MINLSARSYQKELLDNDDIAFVHIQQNMRELNTINSYLGGHSISISGFKKIVASTYANQPITVCEIGCGGGDNLKVIEKWCTQNSIQARFIGIDMKAECVEFAQQQNPALDATWITSDYKEVLFEGNKPDIIFSSLFCHHFTDDAIVKMLVWMKENSTKGFFINDLHRHHLAYYSIKLITSLFSRSFLVKNDAPLSVARGFKKKEWQKIIVAAGIFNCSVNWKWAFRHLIIYTSQNDT